MIFLFLFSGLINITESSDIPMPAEKENYDLSSKNLWVKLYPVDGPGEYMSNSKGYKKPYTGPPHGEWFYWGNANGGWKTYKVKKGEIVQIFGRGDSKMIHNVDYNILIPKNNKWAEDVSIDGPNKRRCQHFYYYKSKSDYLVIEADNDFYSHVFEKVYSDLSNYIWIKEFSINDNRLNIYDIAIDNDGNIYVLISYDRSGYKIYKYSSKGKKIGESVIGENYYLIQVTDIEIDEENNVYTTGALKKDKYSLTSTFLHKISSSGKVIWTKNNILNENSNWGKNIDLTSSSIETYGENWNGENWHDFVYVYQLNGKLIDKKINLGFPTKEIEKPIIETKNAIYAAGLINVKERKRAFLFKFEK